MTLRQIVDRVSAEARIKGTSSLTGLIIVTVNSILAEYTGRRRYPETFQPGIVIEPGGADPEIQNEFELPSDTQHIDWNSIQFSEDGDLTKTYGLLRSTRWLGPTDSWPNRVMKVGNQLRVFPYGNIEATSRLVVDVWVKPQDMVGTANIFPIPALEQTVLKETIAYISRHSDTPVTAQYIQDAARSYSMSFGMRPQE